MSQVTPEPYAFVDAVPEPETPTPATTTGPSLLARSAAELFGSFVLVLAGLGTFLFSSYSGAGTLGVALAFGFGTIAAMTAIGQISGGHLNPAITLGSALAGRTRWLDVLAYWVAQLIGAVIAASVVFLVLVSFAPFAGAERTQFSAVANGYDIYTPLVRTTDTSSQMVGLETLGAFVLEAVLTAVLVGVALAVTRRGADDRLPRTAPAAVGATLTVAMLIAIPLTNGGLNPARAFAAALYSDSWVWGQLWVFLVAPLVGAVVAGLLYRAFAPGEPIRDDELDDLDLDDDVLVLDDVQVYGTGQALDAATGRPVQTGAPVVVDVLVEEVPVAGTPVAPAPAAPAVAAAPAAAAPVAPAPTAAADEAVAAPVEAAPAADEAAAVEKVAAEPATTRPEAAAAATTEPAAEPETDATAPVEAEQPDADAGATPDAPAAPTKAAPKKTTAPKKAAPKATGPTATEPTADAEPAEG